MKCESCGAQEWNGDGGIWVCSHCGAKQTAPAGSTARLKCFACDVVGTSHRCALCAQYFCREHADVFDALDLAACIGCLKSHKGREFQELTVTWRQAWKEVSELGRRLLELDQQQESGLIEQRRQHVVIQSVLGGAIGLGLGLIAVLILPRGLGCLVAPATIAAGSMVLMQRARSPLSGASVAAKVERQITPQRDRLKAIQQEMKTKLVELEAKLKSK